MSPPPGGAPHGQRRVRPLDSSSERGTVPRQVRDLRDVLLIDENSSERVRLGSELERLGVRVVAVDTDNQIAGVQVGAVPDLIVVAPGNRSIDRVMRAIRNRFVSAPIVVVVDRPTVTLAFRAGRLRAVECLVRPVSAREVVLSGSDTSATSV